MKKKTVGKNERRGEVIAREENVAGIDENGGETRSKRTRTRRLSRRNLLKR
jgi:hypothetical protein